MLNGSHNEQNGERHEMVPRGTDRPVRVLGVIPARLGSTRLPRKVLRLLAGRPLLAWVVEAAQRSGCLDDVVVATDADEVADLCQREGWPCEMTSAAHTSGTDRLHEVSTRRPAEIYVNVQGDEPLLAPEHLRAVLAPFADPAVDVTTLRVRCTPENLNNPNAVKVVSALDGRALYFSRATIPFDRDAAGGAAVWKHIGLYAYRRAALARFSTLPPSPLELTERLEQLRLLENGLSLSVGTVEQDTIGVDTEDDLRAVEALLLRRLERDPVADLER